jgi:hypothetical protein
MPAAGFFGERKQALLLFCNSGVSKAMILPPVFAFLFYGFKR